VTLAVTQAPCDGGRNSLRLSLEKRNISIHLRRLRTLVRCVFSAVWSVLAMALVAMPHGHGCSCDAVGVGPGHLACASKRRKKPAAPWRCSVGSADSTATAVRRRGCRRPEVRTEGRRGPCRWSMLELACPETATAGPSLPSPGSPVKRLQRQPLSARTIGVALQAAVQSACHAAALGLCGAAHDGLMGGLCVVDRACWSLDEGALPTSSRKSFKTRRRNRAACLPQSCSG
jgi:hypothetical protein